MSKDFDDVIIITCYGGPLHGRRFKRHGVSFIRANEGHYATVRGGLKDAYYWHNFSTPIAVRQGANLVPVKFLNR